MFTNQQQKKKKHQITPEDECESLGNVLAQFDEKRLDSKHVLQWPVTCKPRTICSKVDQRRSSSKSLFRHNLQLTSPSLSMTTVLSDVSCYIVDATPSFHRQLSDPMNLYKHGNHEQTSSKSIFFLLRCIKGLVFLWLGVKYLKDGARLMTFRLILLLCIGLNCFLVVSLCW